MADHPGGWIRMTAKKFFLVWNDTEATDTEDLDTHAEWSWPLRASRTVLHFGVLAPVALIGMWLSRERGRDLWILYAMITAYTISVALFYVLARYRYPLVPLLVLFAGVAFVEVRGWWSRRAALERLRLVALAGSALVLCNWPLLSTEAMRATTYFNIGRALHAAGHEDDAIRAYRQALELHPGHANAHTNLGVVLAARGEHEDALRHYLEAVRIDPDLAGAHTNLGLEFATRGRVTDAIDHFQRALRLRPSFPEAQANLERARMLVR